MNMWLFPPETQEIQFDEKWSFVGKKEKNCSEEEKTFGDQWDYIAIDAESRLIVSFVPGKRTHENCQKVVEDVYARTQGREDVLLSSDSYAPYKTVIERIEHSQVSTTINTSFVERVNGTDRMQNSRKVRDTYGFSKDLEFHNALTMLIICLYNSCWCVRTLYLIDDGKRVHRTPAMAAKLSEHVWTVAEWVTYPTYDRHRAVKYKPFPSGAKCAVSKDLASAS